jgi:hypothetical protein
MKLIISLSLLLATVLSATVMTAKAQTPDKPLYEIRTYHCNEGKRPDLIARFQNHTTRIFENHGMENIGYWLSTENENDLIYILAFPNNTARDAAWKDFIADDEWKDVYAKSIANGKIVKNIDSEFLTLNPELTKEIKTDSELDSPVFELRTYYCFPDKFPNIVARFRDHTRVLFEKHGMVNVAYFQTVKEDGSQPELKYIIAHKNMEAAKVSWDAFRNDPEWKKVAEASQVDGKIVEKVVSVYMTALPFSDIK